MTVRRQTIETLKAISPRCLCDVCLTEVLRCERSHANRLSRELAGTSQFHRGFGQCSRCSQEKLTTRYVGDGNTMKTAPMLRLVK